MEVIQAEFEAWRGQRSLEDDLLILLEIIPGPCPRVKMLLAGEYEFTINCPSGYPRTPRQGDSFVIESTGGVALWCNSLNEFLLETTPSTLASVFARAAQLHSGRGSCGSGGATEMQISDDEMADSADEGTAGADGEDDEDNEFYMDDDDDDTFTTGWDLEVARKKKRWLQKEEEIRATFKKIKSGDDEFGMPLRVTGAEQKQASQIFTSNAASGILTNDLVNIMERTDSIGFSAEPVEDNIYSWTVHVFGFDSHSDIAKDLQEVAAKFGYNYLELQVDFAIDLFPFYPPLVKVIRPRLKDSMMQRVTSLESLKLSFWNPAKSMQDVIQSVIKLLSDCGRLEVDNEMNDMHSYPEGAYFQLEHHLLRLALVSEVSPRTNARYVVDYKPAPQLAVKKSPSNGKEVAAESAGEHPFWAAGTGYGHGHKTQSDWDPKAYLAAQQEKDKQVLDVLVLILKELRQHVTAPLRPTASDGGVDAVASVSMDTGGEAKTLDANVICSIVEGSAFIPFLEQYLRTESILDMSIHAKLYETVFDCVGVLASHPAFIPLVCPLPNQDQSLNSLVLKLKTSCAVFLERLKKGKATGQGLGFSTDERLASKAVGLAVTVEAAVAAHGPRQVVQPVQPVNRSQEELTAEKLYCTCLKDLQFDTRDFSESGDFVHHYVDAMQSEVNAQPKRVHRIAQELCSLASSLPLNLSSSVFVRADDDNVFLMKALITGPEGTPYSNGCFLFDIYFPSNYPAGPPKVNLETTGNGTVRFNPNLYNTGKVCLSLLGTWEGQVGENWNSDSSTLLQVLVSIQSLILVPNPWFNEPGYEREMGTPRGKINSMLYNRNIRSNCVRWAMIEQLRNPPAGFADVVAAHFYLRQEAILKEVNEWLTEAKDQRNETGGGDSRSLLRQTPAVAVGQLEKLIGELKAELKKLKPPAGYAELTMPN